MTFRERAAALRRNGLSRNAIAAVLNIDAASVPAALSVEGSYDLPQDSVGRADGFDFGVVAQGETKRITFASVEEGGLSNAVGDPFNSEFFDTREADGSDPASRIGLDWVVELTKVGIYTLSLYLEPNLPAETTGHVALSFEATADNVWHQNAVQPCLAGGGSGVLVQQIVVLEPTAIFPKVKNSSSAAMTPNFANLFVTYGL